MDKWEIFHKYWKKVLNKELPVPYCPRCEDSQMFPFSTDDLEPVLECLACTTRLFLGGEFYRNGEL